MLEVAAATYWAHRQLKRTPLKIMLERVISYRRKHADQPSTVGGDPMSSRLITSALQFSSARLYVPVETCCLPDSLALSMFLARRGFNTDLVIAVAADPFAAHAWVQIEDIVLNDSIGAVQAYEPILVI